MLSSLQRWFRRKSAKFPGQPPPSATTAGGRFLTAKFQAPQTDAVFTLGAGRDIAYRLYLPGGSARNDSLPLIVMLHGCKQDAAAFADGTRMNALAEEYRCAVLYPEQSKQANPLLCWNWFERASLEGRGEAALLAGLIEQVGERRPIDLRRVCVVGMSAGGAMACLLAIRHSRLFAACVIHSGLMYGAASSPMQALAAMRSGPSAALVDRARQLACEAGERASLVPTLVIQGDADATVNPANADLIIEQLQARAKCLDASDAGLAMSVERRVDGAGRVYREQNYTQRGRLVLRKILIEGLGHAWSGGDANYEFNDAVGPDASRLALDFMETVVR